MNIDYDAWDRTLKRIAALETQLAEERAKLTQTDHAWKLALATIDDLECEVEEERAKRETSEDRADKSERGLHVAESLIRAITIQNELDGVDIDSLIAKDAGKPTMRERVEKAEARVAEQQAALDVLTNDVSFWQEMTLRAKCGCIDADCRVHGAYDPAELGRVRKATAKEPAR